MRVFRYLYHCWAILLVMFVFHAADAASAATGPEIVGEAAVLVSNSSGQTLWEKNPHRQMYPASTTKTLTAVIALENSNLTDLVRVPREACGVEGSAIGLQEGEIITMEDLLYALMLNSGNDVAIAIAHHVGGSVDAFVSMMNLKAAQLGAVNSHFTNPNGLPDPNHYSTAYDLALITGYAMRHPDFRRIVQTKTTNIKREVPEAQTYLLNHNKMLWRYEGATGVKTGYTDAAGQCLIATAVRQGRELTAVVLGSQGASIWDDVQALLDYGFSAFNQVVVTDAARYVTDAQVKNGVSEAVPVITGRALTFDFPSHDPAEISYEIRLTEKIKAPVESGEKLGEMIFYTGEREIGRVDLVSQQAVPKKPFNWRPWLVMFLLLLILRAAFMRRRRTRRRRPSNWTRRKYYGQ